MKHESTSAALYPAIADRLRRYTVYRACDYGAGNGRFWAYATCQPAELVLFDPNMEHLRPILHPVVANAICFDVAEALPVGYFDVVICSLVLMAICDANELLFALDTLARILRPGGRLIVSITHPCFIDRRHADFVTSFYNGRQLFSYLQPNTEFSVTLFSEEGELTITDSHRPLSYYVEQLLLRGFGISYIGEISASHRADERGAFVPAYLLIECEMLDSRRG